MDISFASDNHLRPPMLRESRDAILTVVTSIKADPGTEDHPVGSNATCRQAVVRRLSVLSRGECRRRYHCAPVFFLYLTGAAKENFVIARSPRRASAARRRSP